MENPERGGEKVIPDLEAIEQQLFTAEQALKNVRNTEDDLVNVATGMAEGNRRLDKAVSSSPSFRLGYKEIERDTQKSFEEELGLEEADIKVEQQRIDAIKQRLANLEANPMANIDLEQIKASLGIAEKALKEKREQLHLCRQASYETILDLKKKHTGFYGQQDDIAKEEGLTFAVQTTLAAHQLEHPEPELNKDELTGKVEQKLKQRGNERKLSEDLDKEEPRLAQDKKLLADVQQEFLSIQIKNQTQLDRVRRQISDKSFLAEIAKLKKEHSKKDNAKIFRAKANKQKNRVVDQLNTMFGELVTVLNQEQKRVGGFYYRHSRYNNNETDSIYNIRPYNIVDASSLTVGQYPESLVSRLKDFESGVDINQATKEELLEKIEKYNSSFNQNIRELVDEINKIFALRT